MEGGGGVTNFGLVAVDSVFDFLWCVAEEVICLALGDVRLASETLKI